MPGRTESVDRVQSPEPPAPPLALGGNDVLSSRPPLPHPHPRIHTQPRHLCVGLADQPHSGFFSSGMRLCRNRCWWTAGGVAVEGGTPGNRSVP